MVKKSEKEHKHIKQFHPDVTLLKSTHQEFLSEIERFDAGEEYINFNDFISEEAIDYTRQGNGVTYIV